MIDVNKGKLSAKEQNIVMVLNELILNSNLLPTEIGQSTNLSPATVSRILGQLQDSNLAINVGKVETVKGRKPNQFSFNKNYGYILHYYVKKNKIIGYLINLGGDVIDQCEMLYDQQATLEDLLDIISDIKQKLRKNKELKTAQILAAGFAVPGVVDKTTRKLYMIPDVLSLNETTFYDYAEKILGVPVIVNNVSWMAALGEKNTNYSFADNIVYLNITNSIGIGAGIIIDNKLVRGANDYAGEVGQFYFDPCYSMGDYLNSKGQLEHEASLNTLFSAIENIIKKGGAKVLSDILKENQQSNIFIDTLEEAARRGDVDVLEELERTLKAWSVTIININYLLNPDYIILGGAISEKNNYIYEYLTKILSSLGIFCPKIKFSTLGDDAQLIGGTDVLKQYVFNNNVLLETKKII
ncbi:MAG: ROK family transcriptional regulator [Eubacteriales bacterium]